MKRFAVCILVLACMAGLLFYANAKDKEFVAFHGVTIKKSDLSKETWDWLQWYNGLTEVEQASINYIPTDLYELCGYPTVGDAVYETEETTPDVSEQAVIGGDLLPMVVIDGELYGDSGKESTRERDESFDGRITSSVDSGQKPTEDDQSNFGMGYGYQYGPNGTIEIFINNKWCVFLILADAV